MYGAYTLMLSAVMKLISASITLVFDNKSLKSYGYVAEGMILRIMFLKSLVSAQCSIKC